jgi:hypothetical protein
LYLPAIASLLILCITFTSLGAVVAQTTLRAIAQPTLQVVTIAEDDEKRETGIMVLGLYPHTGPGINPWPNDKPLDPYCTADSHQFGPCIDKLSQHKILVTFNGVPVNFNVDCQFIKKEKMHPLQKPQFVKEQLRTVLTDESANFVCKLRSGKPGVGVLDVYYVGPQLKQFIADYVMVVTVWTRFGATTVYGAELQDICVLGWALGHAGDPPNTFVITKPDGTHHFSWPDPLGNFAGCEEAALWERDAMGLPVLYD